MSTNTRKALNDLTNADKAKLLTAIDQLSASAKSMEANAKNLNTKEGAARSKAKDLLALGKKSEASMVYKQAKSLAEQHSNVKNMQDTLKRQIDVIAGRQQRPNSAPSVVPALTSVPRHSPPVPTLPSVPRHSPPRPSSAPARPTLQSNIRRFQQTHCENREFWPNSSLKCACKLLKTPFITREAIQKVETILKDNPKIIAIDLLKKVKAAEAASTWSIGLPCVSRHV